MPSVTRGKLKAFDNVIELKSPTPKLPKLNRSKLPVVWVVLDIQCSGIRQRARDSEQIIGTWAVDFEI